MARPELDARLGAAVLARLLSDGVRVRLVGERLQTAPKTDLDPRETHALRWCLASLPPHPCPQPARRDGPFGAEWDYPGSPLEARLLTMASLWPVRSPIAAAYRALDAAARLGPSEYDTAAAHWRTAGPKLIEHQCAQLSGDQLYEAVRELWPADTHRSELLGYYDNVPSPETADPGLVRPNAAALGAGVGSDGVRAANAPVAAREGLF